MIAHHAGAHTIAIEGVDILLGPNSTLSPLAAAIDEYELARARTHTRTHTHTIDEYEPAWFHSSDTT